MNHNSRGSSVVWDPTHGSSLVWGVLNLKSVVSSRFRITDTSRVRIPAIPRDYSPAIPRDCPARAGLCSPSVTRGGRFAPFSFSQNPRSPGPIPTRCSLAKVRQDFGPIGVSRAVFFALARFGLSLGAARACWGRPHNDLSSVAAGVCRKASDQPKPVATQKHH
jgi:hypothetical protein